MQIVPVSVGENRYDIEIAPGNLDHVGDLLALFNPISLVVILTDQNVHECGYATRVAESISRAGLNANILSIPAGEQNKSIEASATLWKMFLEDGVDRQSVLLALGGGVIGDLGGFLAATYTRGIRYFQVPTTLLAQVDSSVGGKVGIDLPGAKNMVGAFYQPIGVSIDPEVLGTLPEEQYRSGLGEVVKYGLSLDSELLFFLERNTDLMNERDPTTMREIIAWCCRIKAKIVAEDPLETKGQRILLNYGHTFGHAFETSSQFRLPHGVAVAIGSVFAARMALKLGLIDVVILNRHLKLLQALNLPILPTESFDVDEIVQLMKRDKKTEFGRIRLVLPTGLGSCVLRKDIEQEQLRDVLRQ